LAALVAIPDEKRSFANSFVALDHTVAMYSEAVWRLSFMKDIHPDAKVREVASACEEKAGQYLVGLWARGDLYQAMQGFQSHAGTKVRLDAEATRLVETTMLEFRKNGLLLNEKERARLVAIRSELTTLQTAFQASLNEDTSGFDIPCAELKGLPEDFVASHVDETKKGSCHLTTKYPDYYPVMENGALEATRQKMEVAFMNRGGPKNRERLNKAVALRHEAAKLLGYANHVDVVAADRMAKDSKTIGAFLARMQKGLKPALDAERAKMEALKAKDIGKKKASINAWDWRYYSNQIKKADYAIDDEVVRAYFPADKVLKGMFSVYERLFGITIAPVKGAAVWADGVTLYEIRDTSTKGLLAKFYADLYPREGKYGHAAEFTLSAGHEVQGGYRIPMAALVVNFQPPKDGQVAHLSMNEVDTLFHEFGHVVHETLTTARYSSHAGTRTALDFVEAPSQMLENWAYLPEVLAIISQDPKDPKKGLPVALAEKLSAARKYDAGVHYSRQVFLGLFDQAIHTHTAPGKIDSDAIAKKTWASVLGFAEDKDAHFAGTFGHMMGGYEGGYYGYLWSEVFAADMFTRFQKEGALNPTTGKAYRDLILARGRTVEPSTLLKDFLGREPNEAAFLKMTGISSP